MKINITAAIIILMTISLISTAQPDQEDPKAIYAQAMTKGNGLLQERDFFDAREAFRQALEMKPNDKTALEKIEECETRMQYEYRKINEDADHAYAKGQMAKAKRLYEKSLAYFDNADIQAKLIKTETKPQNVFFSSYGTKNFEEGKAIVKIPSGGYIAVGRSQISTGNSQIFAIKVNNAGNEVWRKTYGYDKEYIAEDIIQLQDGNYLVTGYSEGESVITRQAFILKISPAGDKIWEKHIGGENVIEQAESAVQAHEGGIVVLGQKLDISTESPNSQLYIFATDAQGNIQWEKELGGEASEEASTIKVLPDGYLIVGSSESYGSGNWDMWVIKIDKKGNKIWEKAFGGGDIDRAHDAIVHENGEITLCGYTYSFANASSDGWLVHIDQSGSEKWSTVIGGLSIDECISICKNQDGNLVMAGYSEDYEADKYGQNVSLEKQNVFLVLVNAKDGKKIWERSLGGERAQRGFGIVNAHDGGYVIVGGNMTSGNNKEDLLIMKADLNGLTTAQP